MAGAGTLISVVLESTRGVLIREGKLSVFIVSFSLRGVSKTATTRTLPLSRSVVSISCALMDRRIWTCLERREKGSHRGDLVWCTYGLPMDSCVQVEPFRALLKP